MNIFKLPKSSDVEEFHTGNLDIKIVEIMPENHEHIMDVVRSLYESEPCRICGKVIGDTSKSVFAGYSIDNKSRAAHESCWNKKLPQVQWAYPESAS